jgi:DNA-binding GntR family transcriptional regulator
MTSRQSTKPESKLTQTEKAYQIIKRALLKGEIEEGRFVSEQDLRRRYGISRTPFREACNRLHNEQILEVVPRRGYFVPQLSFRSFGDLLEARLLIEGSIAELAAVRATKEEMRELEEIVGMFSSAKISQTEPEEIIRLNTEFHLCLARMTKNSELIDLGRRILERTERLNYIEYRRSGLPKRLAAQVHEPVLDAIRRRDPVDARRAVRSDILRLQTRTLVSGIDENQRPDRIQTSDTKGFRKRKSAKKSNTTQ